MITINAIRYIKNIRTTGAISGSSDHVIRRLTNNVNPDKPQVIVEFGAGTGNITAAILKRLHPQSKFYCFEIEADFVKDLRKITDKRFQLVEHSALDVSKFIAANSVDVIISTLPMSFFSAEDRSRLLHDCNAILKPEGIFSQFMYKFKRGDFQRAFAAVKAKCTFLNFPPGFLYFCSKRIISKASDTTGDPKGVLTESLSA